MYSGHLIVHSSLWKFSQETKWGKTRSRNRDAWRVGDVHTLFDISVRALAEKDVRYAGDLVKHTSAKNLLDGHLSDFARLAYNAGRIDAPLRCIPVDEKKNWGQL